MILLRKTIKPEHLLVMGAILCQSCVNLKAVGNFSHEAVAGMEQFERIPYGFEMHCEANCLDRNIRDRNINPDTCGCSADKRADSINRVIYLAALDYFQGLSLLADNERAQIHTAGLTNALASGDFGPVTLRKEQADAYSLLGNTLIRAVTDKYRSNHLRTYVAQAEEPLDILLEFLEFNLAGNLYQKLEVRKRRLKGFYFDMARSPELSRYEQTKFVEDYYRKLADLSARQERLQRFSGIIKELQEGHAKLAKQLENPKDSGSRQDLGQASSKLHATIVDFNAVGKWGN